MNNDLPLKELSISQVYNGENAIYEVPIYQRNYAWGKDEIETLVQDVWDAHNKDSQSSYYIGTLVTFYKKEEQTYEVIDGQQRLTTLYLIIRALSKAVNKKLTYRARQRSTNTLEHLGESVEEKDTGIEDGYKFSKDAIGKIVGKDEQEAFANYFLNNVKIIHYTVPRDVDLNHYFEVMNSRGEQLEKHEIVKATLYILLRNDDDRSKFTQIWNACSEMSTYIQANKSLGEYFSADLKDFRCYRKTFDELPNLTSVNSGKKLLADLIDSEIRADNKDDKSGKDTFLPIIDFPNFLLIVLKITLINTKDFVADTFTLDDKEILNEFDEAIKKALSKEVFVKQFCFNLLQAKYLLDNYVVHHDNEEDKDNQNPWQLQYAWRENKDSIHTKNLCGDEENSRQLQNQLVQLLSMFEVSFTARQRKNYLFYVLCHLFKSRDLHDYCDFLESLSKKYFYDIYMNKEECLNEINTPRPGAFDQVILKDGYVDMQITNKKLTDKDFNCLYGDGSEKTKGIPLFVFNYLDYRIWKKYFNEMAGQNFDKDSAQRQAFFSELGCSDFGLEVFNHFYFSRTRRSLEHYYPQANTNEGINESHINCLGNFAMIGSEANSSGSNWSPKAKLAHYLDSSQKISQVSVASLKFRIMMQICSDNAKNVNKEDAWVFKDIKNHQQAMLRLLFDKKEPNMPQRTLA